MVVQGSLKFMFLEFPRDRDFFIYYLFYFFIISFSGVGVLRRWEEENSVICVSSIKRAVQVCLKWAATCENLTLVFPTK